MTWEIDLENAQKEFNKLNEKLQNKFNEESKLYFAFGVNKNEVIKSLEKQGAEIPELVSIGMGGYIHKKDISDFNKLNDYILTTKKEFLNNNSINLCGAYLDRLWDYEARISFDGEGYDRALQEVLGYADIEIGKLSLDQISNLHKTERYYNKKFDEIN